MTVSLEPLARRWAWAWFLGYGLMAIIGYRLIPPGLERDVAYLLIGLTGVAAIGLGLVLHRPAYRLTAARAPVCCSSTSTISRRSMTQSATGRATQCCAKFRP